VPTHAVGSRARVAVSMLTASALLVTGLGYPSAAAEPSAANAPTSDTGLPRADTSDESWRTPDSSVDARPKDLAADLGKRESAKVVSVRDEQGRPVFDAVEVRGKAEAKQVIRQQRGIQNTIAVSVEERQSFVSAAGSAIAHSADPLRTEQWALSTLRADEAWTASRGAGQTVAVLDTGVSAEEDLQENLLSGWDFVEDRVGGRVDSNGHGTHVAGIVAAAQGNGAGTAGLAPDARILPVRVLDQQGMGYWSDIAQGIVYATDRGASVLNLSFSAAQSNASMQTAIGYAASRGRILVAAAGNDGNGVANYPAADPRVIAVAASTRTDTVATFSNYGSYLDLAAPGVGIWSTVPGSFRSDSGTSMATPFVSAAAALLRSAAVDRNLGAIDIVSALTRTAVDIDRPGRDVRSGSGRIDPYAALCEVGACRSAATVMSKVTPTLVVKRRSLVVRLNESGVRDVILKKRLKKRAAKQLYAKGKRKTSRRGKWKIDTRSATSTHGNVSFRLKGRFIYKVTIPATATSEAANTGTIRRR